MTTIIFQHNIDGEFTRVSFEREGDITASDFLGYFIRFALSAGYQMESIEEALVDLYKEFSHAEIISEKDWYEKDDAPNY